MPELGLWDDDGVRIEDEDEYTVVARVLDSFLRPGDGDGAAPMRRDHQDPGSGGSDPDALAIVPVSPPTLEEEIGENASSSLTMTIAGGIRHGAEVEDGEEDGRARTTRRRSLVMEMQDFMKRKSRRRLKFLEQNEKLNPEEVDKINKGLEKIAMLDMKLQELEGGTRNRQQGDRSSDSDASRRLRDERKRRRRYAKLKRSLENLDGLHPDRQGHVFRNIILGPNARYFRLTADEEGMVEELLRQQDIAEDDGESNSSVFSHMSTAFDVEGQEAVRLAEIECRLDPYKESHSYYSISPMASSSTPNSKVFVHGCSSLSASVSTPKSKSCVDKVRSVASGNISDEFSVHHEALSKALEPFAGTTAVEDYLVELKERREYEEKMEEIDKKLRQLHTAEHAITEDQLVQLLNDSKKEQELYAAIQ